MVGQRHRVIIFGKLGQQRLNELVQVINLLELAARILIELAVSRQNMQRLEQINALAGFELQLRSHILRSFCHRFFGALLAIGFSH